MLQASVTEYHIRQLLEMNAKWIDPSRLLPHHPKPYTAPDPWRPKPIPVQGYIKQRNENSARRFRREALSLHFEGRTALEPCFEVWAGQPTHKAHPHVLRLSSDILFELFTNLKVTLTFTTQHSKTSISH
ncbi:hypothetical protein RJT34_28353 [Clitoria ternatea]|uniref:Uncharacterized protein n=1 Tax=Clitoria ternatea TaxID=43366 RepID=A0AAN9ICJ0_CLITE